MVYFHAGKTNCPASLSDGMTSTLTAIVTSTVKAPALDRGLDGGGALLLGGRGGWRRPSESSMRSGGVGSYVRPAASRLFAAAIRAGRARTFSSCAMSSQAVTALTASMSINGIIATPNTVMLSRRRIGSKTDSPLSCRARRASSQ
jgi:hypothetical protein